ncbi:hypothetical protein BC477_09120 [Clavibacter michiganensis subsp. michiganensis]|uniref:Uncharacterized protein n=1 Tax=Clavibacter michiganensis subsp. michiganensis TaxID=33013 RepID=A0A251XN44_CLAMM|nr:hypothetical protein BC477_09120 [Clavibacter michiganensis subsp. michiganensis]OUE04885.1 hypothetical protein CMMCAS07_08045 [Clavibacter michiganensis subsp. michiganensis]
MPADGYASLDGEFADIGRAFLDLSRIRGGPASPGCARSCRRRPAATRRSR